MNGEDLSVAEITTRSGRRRQSFGALVFMHPGGATNLIKEGALRGRGDLGNIIGNPLETTSLLTRLIVDGISTAFPGTPRLRRARGRIPAVVPRPD